MPTLPNDRTGAANAPSPPLADSTQALRPWQADHGFGRTENGRDLLALSVPEQIAQAISERILAGEYAAGSRIQEQTLAERFGVSRGPTREALLMLEREGLVRIETRRGASVTLLSASEVDELFAIRAALLGLATRLFVARATDQDQRTYAITLEQLAASSASDADLYTRWSYALTFFIARNAGSERLFQMLRTLARQTFRYSRLALDEPVRRQQSLEVWRRTLDALRLRDANQMESLMRTLIDATRRTAGTALDAHANAGQGLQSQL